MVQVHCSTGLLFVFSIFLLLSAKFAFFTAKIRTFIFSLLSLTRIFFAFFCKKLMFFRSFFGKFSYYVFLAQPRLKTLFRGRGGRTVWSHGPVSEFFKKMRVQMDIIVKDLSVADTKIPFAFIRKIGPKKGYRKGKFYPKKSNWRPNIGHI